MAQKNQNWDDLGQTIQQIVDQAVRQQDFGKLNQTIQQTIEKAVDVGSDAVRKAAAAANRSTVRPKPKIVPEAKAVNPTQLYAGTGGVTAGGVVKVVFGGVLTFLSLAGGIAGLVVNAVVSGGMWALPLTLGALGIGGGTALLGSGIGNLNRVSRFKSYCAYLGNKTHCSLESLARKVGKSEKFVHREVQKMIRQGWFLQGHLDKEETRLITTHETFQQFEQSRLQLEQRQKQQALEQAKRDSSPYAPQVKEVLEKGDAFLEEIRRCNDAIPGQEISRKIFQIEAIVERIFERAESHPEIVPDLKKMMDYYLPMTVKLLKAYADMDAQPVQGENIANSKREIEETLDTLNQAFEKLLDSVFADTALDISSDISVLNTLLAQDGLKEDDMKL